MKKWIWITLAIVIVIAGSVWLLNILAGSDPAQPETTKPEFRDIVKQTIVTGSIEPNQEVEIKSSVSGILDEIFVGTGDVVERGQSLARIRIVPEPEQINEAESAVERAKISFRRAQQDFERKKGLFESDVISKVEFESAENEFDIRREELKAAENRLEIVQKGATLAMEETTNIITSTMDGMIMNVPVREGSSIMGRGTFNEGTTIMVVADMDNMVFQGEVGESDVARLKPGMELDLTVGAMPEEHFIATLGFVAPRGNKVEGIVKYSISASVDTENQNFLRAGYSANAEIVLDRRDSVLSVREQYLQFEDRKPYLNVVNDAGESEKRFIETGISDGIYVEILSGIQPEEAFKTTRVGSRHRSRNSN